MKNLYIALGVLVVFVYSAYAVYKFEDFRKLKEEATISPVEARLSEDDEWKKYLTEEERVLADTLRDRLTVVSLLAKENNKVGLDESQMRDYLTSQSIRVASLSSEEIRLKFKKVSDEELGDIVKRHMDLYFQALRKHDETQRFEHPELYANQ